MTLQAFLTTTLILAFLAWLGVSLHVVFVQRRRARAHAVATAAVQALQQADIRALPIEGRVAYLTPMLRRASRALVMRAAAEDEVSKEAFDALSGHLVQRWGRERLVDDAMKHRSARDKWRRMAALRILFRRDDSETMTLLKRAATDADGEVASAALALLGQSRDPEAIDVLLEALRDQRQPASRIAIHLEQSPQDFGARLRPLLGDSDPVVRFWSATLLGRYPDTEGLEAELAPLTDDADPRVRKAAIVSLGKVGDRIAGAAAQRLLGDPEPFVRAHAARALGELNRLDCASEVASLLSDQDWWVRKAAKDALEMMGSDVWPILIRCLEHSDTFVRNGAAELFQNLGILDNLIVLEAATDDPSDAKIDMLRKITAAGGTRLTHSLIERAGPATRMRIRHLLNVIGLEHVAA